MKRQKLTEQEIQQINDFLDSTELDDPIESGGSPEGAPFNWIDSTMDCAEEECSENENYDDIFGIKANLDDLCSCAVCLTKVMKDNKIFYEIARYYDFMDKHKPEEVKYYQSFEKAMKEFSSVKEEVIEFWR